MINMPDCETTQAYDVPFITHTTYNEQCDKFIPKAVFIRCGLFNHLLQNNKQQV